MPRRNMWIELKMADRLEWVEAQSARGAIDKELAKALHIGMSTFYKWRREHPDFVKALKNGKPVADAKVELAMFRRAIGYETTETKQIVSKDEHGNNKPIRIERTVKHIAGDVTAQIFWLKNRRSDLWRDRRELEIDDGPQKGIESMTEEELDAELARLDRAQEKANRASTKKGQGKK